MVALTLFPEDNDSFVNRVKALVTQKYGTMFEHDTFVSQFNQDATTFNEILKHAYQECQLLDKAYQFQAQHNAHLEEGQQKWHASGKSIQMGAQVVHELAIKKKAFERSHKQLEAYREKKALATQFVDEEKPWAELEALCHHLPDNERQKTIDYLKNIRENWSAQGALAHYNAEDIEHLQSELKKIDDFLDFLESIRPDTPTSPDDKKFCKVLTHNQNAILALKSQINASIAWKVKAAARRKNLWYDDGLWVLLEDIKEKFSSLDKSLLDPIAGYFKTAASQYARTLTPDRFSRFINTLEQDPLWQGYWLGAYWAQPEGEFTIPVMQHAGTVVPAIVADTLPAEGANKEIDVYMQQFFNDGCLSVVQLNECAAQIKKFLEGIQYVKNLKLEILAKSPGFRSALIIHQLIEQEKAKISTMMPYQVTKWVMGSFPFFNHLPQYQWANFLSAWQKKLIDVSVDANELGKKITDTLVRRLEYDFISSIKNGNDIFPDNVINDIKLFVNFYGDTVQNEALNGIFEPKKILQTFDFLVPSDENGRRAVDIEAMVLFLDYAEKNWSQHQFQAAKLITKIIKGEWYPTNEQEEIYLQLLVSSLLVAQDDANEYLELMRFICKYYVQKTGNIADENAYYFLQRFDPDSAKQWAHERSRDIDEKYIMLHKMLNVNCGDEINLYQHGENTEKDKLRYSDFKQYLYDIKYHKDTGVEYLKPVIEQYLKSYNGQNNHYAELILELANIMDQKQYFKQYLEKRIKYLISKIANHRYVKIDQLDHVLLKKHEDEGYNHLVETALLAIIKHKETPLLSKTFFNLIEKNASIAVREQYRIKCVAQLLKEKEIKKTESFARMIMTLPKEYQLSEGLVKSTVAKKKLKSVYQRYLIKMDEYAGPDFNWDGNGHVIINSFASLDNPDNITYLNYQWLKEFLHHPENFNINHDKQRPDIDKNFHKDFLSIPNDKKTIKDFFGRYASNVKLIVMSSLENFNPNFNYAVYNLLSRYIDDPYFKTQKDWPLLSKKIAIRLNVYNIYQQFENKNYVEAYGNLSDLLSEYAAIQSLSAVDAELSNYYHKIVSSFLDSLLDYSKHETFSESFLNDVISEKDIGIPLKQGRANIDISEILKIKNLPNDFKEKFSAICKQRAEAIKAIKNIFNKPMHRIKLEAEGALALNAVLSEKMQTVFSHLLQDVFRFYNKNDDQYQLCQAYLSVVSGENIAADLSRYKAIKQKKNHSYKKIAKELTYKTIDALTEKKSLDGIFNLSQHSKYFYMNIANHMTDIDRKSLIAAIQSEMKRLSQAKTLIPHSHFVSLSVIYHWLCEQNNTLAQHWDTLIADKIKWLDQHILSAEHATSVKNNASFIRAFAQTKDLASCFEVIEKAAQAQRQKVISYLSDEGVCDEIAHYKAIINRAGSAKQLERSKRLLNEWSVFRHYDENLMTASSERREKTMAALSSLRIETITQTFDTYIKDLKLNFFNYFINGLNIRNKPAFYKAINTLCDDLEAKNIADGFYIDFEKLLEHYDIDIFSQLLQAHATTVESHWWQRMLATSLPAKVEAISGAPFVIALAMSIRVEETKTAWLKKLKSNRNIALAQFKPTRVSDLLNERLDELVSAFEEVPSDFVKSMREAIKAAEVQFNNTEKANAVDVAGMNVSERFLGRGRHQLM